MDWGHPETFKQMWGHITRQQYKVNYDPSPRTLAGVSFQLATLGRYYLAQFSPAVGFFSIIGIPLVVLRRKEAKWWGMSAVMLGVFAIYGWLLNTKPEVQEVEANKVFFIPIYCLVAILIAGGLDVIGRRLSDILGRRLSFVPSHLLGLACLCIPAGLALANNWSANDFSHYWYAEDHTQNLLTTLDKNAVIFPSGDHNTFPLIYFHRVEKKRPDITIGDKYGYVEARDFPELQKYSSPEGRIPKNQVIDYLLSRTNRATYFTVKHNFPKGIKVHQFQVGLLYKASRQPPSKDRENIWTKYEYRNAKNGFQSPPDYGALNVVSDYFYFRGLSLLKKKKTEEALSMLSRSAQVAEGIKEVYNNIGSALAEHGQLAVARQYYQKALGFDGKYVSALWNIARTSSVLGDSQGAAQYFQKLHSVNPNDFRVLGELGFLHYRRLGDTKLATSYFRDSLRLNPDQRQILDVLQRIDTALYEKMPVLKADRDSHDFGKVAIGERRSTAFKLTNVSNRPLVIEDVRADCGCTVPKVSKRKLDVGETTEMQVEFRERKKLGPMKRHITIKISTGHAIQIDIHVNIIPLFFATPDNLRVAEAIPNVPKMREVIITSHDNKPFAIKKIESSMDEVHPIVVDNKKTPRNRYVISLKISPNFKIGKREGVVRIHIDDKEKNIITLPISLNVRQPAIVTPKSLFLSGVESRENIIVSCTVDLPKDWSAKITKIQYSAGWMKVLNAPKTLAGRSKLNIEVDAKTLPRTFSGTITIRTDHRSIPHIIIPVYGFVKG